MNFYSRVGIIQCEHKFFPWLQNLLQENYVEYKQEHVLKGINVLQKNLELSHILKKK